MHLKAGIVKVITAGGECGHPIQGERLNIALKGGPLHSLIQP